MPNRQTALIVCSLLGLAIIFPHPVRAADRGNVPQYGVLDIPFAGPELGPTDTPARDVELAVTFRHESGDPAVRVHGFWDGDGRGGSRGNVFKVRFCPTKPGRWQLVETSSNHPELKGQRQGDALTCTPSTHPGFWLADGRWYKRSDGSHPFVVGNTHYSFLSKRTHEGPVKTDPAADVRGNAKHFGKLRFALTGDRYPDPDLKPFFDDQGKPTNDGRFSHRPNPAWFHGRADPAVAEGHKVDLACDLILCGPDTRESRSTLLNDPKPWLKYVAARYGSYPNVWFCLCNEYDIKEPKYTPERMAEAGRALRLFLAYPSPISIHAAPGDWKEPLNEGGWHDHVILQFKLKRIAEAADAAARNFPIGGNKPVVNDENAYQGEGDKFSETDTVEGCFGTFLGGGYPTTGEKYGNKLGQYFWGSYDPAKHTAAPKLGYLRDYVNRRVRFWELEPVRLADTPFNGLPGGFRVLGKAGREYVLGSNRAIADARMTLPPGSWKVTQVDLMEMRTKTLADAAAGELRLTVPDSRAVLTHFRKESD